jgi:hypothetical protein
MERSAAKYLLMAQEKQASGPVNLAWTPYLLKSSGAFDAVYSSYLPSGQGLVLLKWTGGDPAPAPTGGLLI